MQGTKVQKGNRGITLIALVVTIIVLLILAGVSIQMITGQSGILSQARQAKEETVKGQIRDNVRREIMEKMTEKYGEDLTAEELKDILDNYFTEVPEPGEGEDNPWNAKDFPASFQLHSKEGNYTFNLGELYSGTLSGTQTGEVVHPTPEIPEAGTEVAVPEGKNWNKETKTVTPTADGQGNVIPIPERFYYVGGTKDIGFVISDVEKDNLNNDARGNQFVWVPVPKAIGTVTVGTDITCTDDEKNTPMAELIGGTANYGGILYEGWNTTNSTVKARSYAENTRYREPSLVTGSSGNQYDAVGDNIKKVGIADGSAETFKKQMQTDYNNMVSSVDKYGGFYVARYEMSLTDWEGQAGKKKAQFIKGATSANESSSSANTWYGLYAYNKEFATANGHSSVVESSMMWGSQYDAMMNWMARSGINVAKYPPIEGTSKNTGSTTGTVDTDVLNNVYDLLGNRWEWTLEPYDTSFRTLRGGRHDVDLSPSDRSFGFDPTLKYGEAGSHASLYIL